MKFKITTFATTAILATAISATGLAAAPASAMTENNTQNKISSSQTMNPDRVEPERFARSLPYTSRDECERTREDVQRREKVTDKCHLGGVIVWVFYYL